MSSREGIVIGLVGNWKMEGKGLLSLGDPVRVGAKITPTPPATLTLWFEGQPPYSYSCRQLTCPEIWITDVSIGAAKSNPPQKSLLARSFALLVSIFPEEPGRYFTAASRGLEGDLKEAVLPLQSSQVDLAPAFADLSAETYWVRFESLHDHASKTAPIQVHWQPGKPALVPAAGFKPGLYRLTLLEESDQPTGSEAWILLTGREEYSAAAAAFQDVAKTVAAWPASSDPSAIRAVLRASLEALSKPEKGPARP